MGWEIRVLKARMHRPLALPKFRSKNSREHSALRRLYRHPSGVTTDRSRSSSAERCYGTVGAVVATRSKQVLKSSTRPISK
jgi:hypothetical protein